MIRAYWDGNAKPSVEVPVGDLFGLNLGQYVIYQSAYLNCSSIKALNCYFAMPFRRSALITATNEGKQPVGSFYSNIDYQLVPALPDDVVYFHAQYRQQTPNQAVKFATGEKELNNDGKSNYVFAETRGSGHLMGITLGVLQNADNWFGEGDDMIFIDDESKPAIIGTGTEDYINGAWDFGGRDGAVPFAHLYNGAQYHPVSRAWRGTLSGVPMAWRQSRHLRALSEAHDRAWPRQRSRRQLLLGLLLVSEPALYRFPAAARGRRPNPGVERLKPPRTCTPADWRLVFRVRTPGVAHHGDAGQKPGGKAEALAPQRLVNSHQMVQNL